MPVAKHFAALDGLRGVAAFMVLIGHLELHPYFHPPHFELAVDFFFLLSGFVIAHAYEKKLREGMTFLAFARIRLVRLYPLILLSLVIGATILFARAWSGQDREFWGPGFASLGLATFMLPSPLLHYTVGDGAYPFNVPSWSLLAELVINAAYALCVRQLTNRILMGTIVVGAFLILVFGVDGGSTWQTLPIGMVRVLFSFAAGIGVYRLFVTGRIPRLPLPFLAIVALLLLAFSLPRGEFSYLGESVAVLIVFPLIVLAGAQVRLRGRLEKLALFAGKLSYPLYILHHPLLKPFANIARTQNFTGPVFVAWTILEILIILVIAYVAMKLFDEPARRFLDAAARRTTKAAATDPAP